MRSHPLSPTRRTIVASLLVLGIGSVIGSAVGAGNPALRVLIVGGGPEPNSNQVAIERNVAYVSRLPRVGTPLYTLFADGDMAAKTVLYEEEPRLLPTGEQAFALLFESRGDARPTVQRFRAPRLARLDGPAKRTAVTEAVAWLGKGAPDRALLYFTGHGSQPRNRDLDNNQFDLWGEALSVRDLAAHLATLPPRTAVTLVMVQCYAGAFANLIFTGGDPAAGMAEREIAGFFASPRERSAAGCTPELNEANYRDFSSYFFAALTGRDRVGRSVTGADANRDGRVGMDEAFAYTCAHDASIDVPVCTSDVFLRWALPEISNDAVFAIPYSQARGWATPAQGMALDTLSRDLQLSGETRSADAYRMMVEGVNREAGATLGRARRQFRAAREELRSALLPRWPELEQSSAERGGATRAGAVAELNQRAAAGELQALLDADLAMEKAEAGQMEAEIQEARVLRFVRVVKSVVLAHHLRESGDPTRRTRFERLVKAESLSPLPTARPASAARSAN